MRERSIVYWGPAFAGKTTNLQAVWRNWDPSSRSDCRLRPATGATQPTILSFRVEREGEWFLLSTVPGAVFESAGRREILADAEAVVFVADSRPERANQNVESWDNLQEAMSDRESRLPIVIQYNHRDAAGARPVEEIQTDLNVQPLFGFAGTQVANPYAILVSEHVSATAVEGVGVLETLEAAVQALQRGVPSGEDVEFIGMQQIDAVIRERLTQNFSDVPGIDRLVADAMNAVQGRQDGAFDELKSAIVDHARNEVIEAFLNNDELREQLLGMMGSLRADELEVSLQCASCDTAVAAVPTFLRDQPDGSVLRVGDRFLDVTSVPADRYMRMDEPDGEVRVLEFWECDACRSPGWLGLTFVDGILRAAVPARFDRSTFFGAHIVAAEAALVASRYSGEDPYLLTPDLVASILDQHLD